MKDEELKKKLSEFLGKQEFDNELFVEIITNYPREPIFETGQVPTDVNTVGVLEKFLADSNCTLTQTNIEQYLTLALLLAWKTPSIAFFDDNNYHNGAGSSRLYFIFEKIYSFYDGSHLQQLEHKIKECFEKLWNIERNNASLTKKTVNVVNNFLSWSYSKVKAVSVAPSPKEEQQDFEPFPDSMFKAMLITYYSSDCDSLKNILSELIKEAYQKQQMNEVRAIITELGINMESTLPRSVPECYSGYKDDVVRFFKQRVNAFNKHLNDLLIELAKPPVVTIPVLEIASNFENSEVQETEHNDEHHDINPNVEPIIPVPVIMTPVIEEIQEVPFVNVSNNQINSINLETGLETGASDSGSEQNFEPTSFMLGFDPEEIHNIPVAHLYQLPDGSVYEVPNNDFTIADKIKTDWETRNQPRKFPLYAKICRSKVDENGKHSVKIKMPFDDENPSLVESNVVTIDSSLTHSFVMRPVSDQDETLVLCPVQHEKKEEQSSKYLHRVRFKDRPDKNVVAVKWIFGREAADQLGVYKVFYASKMSASSIQDIDIWLAKPKRIGNKIIQISKYLGPDLRRVLDKSEEKPSSEKLIAMAEKCWERVRALNEGTLVTGTPPCLHNDLKLKNFTLLNDEVYLIDVEAVVPINSENQKESVEYSDSYAAPEVVRSKGLNTSIASDIYSLGLVIENLLENCDKIKDFNFLIERMLKLDPTRRITHKNIEHWFALRNRESKLFKQLASTSLFQQEAFNYCLKYFSHIDITQKFLANLFHPEYGVNVACTILGVAEYLSSKPSLSLIHRHGSQKRPENLIVSLIREKEHLTPEKVAEHIEPAIKKSQDHLHSRKTVFDKYKTIAEKFKPTDSIADKKTSALTSEQQAVIVELNRYFPKQHNQWKKIVENELLLNIIKKSIEYLKKNPGWHGKNSVCKLVETLLSDSFEKKTKNSNTETAMQTEVGKCINGAAMRYKRFWFISQQSSEDKTNSRKNIFKDLDPINVTYKSN